MLLSSTIASAIAYTKLANKYFDAGHSSLTSIDLHDDLDFYYEGLRAQLTEVRPQTNNSRLSLFDHIESHSPSTLLP
ncbi:unnamed protein product [Schistocephalus solidus]|uniref:Uncharacterized protein n=1 Tax=Schistocephalus solidus TaxID=70667 RepID=A0A183S9V4_SCHSO|nr:unnamed protein product [Schistocephalus solidus]